MGQDAGIGVVKGDRDAAPKGLAGVSPRHELGQRKDTVRSGQELELSLNRRGRDVGRRKQ